MCPLKNKTCIVSVSSTGGLSISGVLGGGIL